GEARRGELHALCCAPAARRTVVRIVAWHLAGESGGVCCLPRRRYRTRLPLGRAAVAPLRAELPHARSFARQPQFTVGMLRSACMRPLNHEAMPRIGDATPTSTAIALSFLGARMLIKMDVEGLEHDVLLGAPRMLARKPTWVVEITLNEHRQQPNPHFGDTFEIF